MEQLNDIEDLTVEEFFAKRGEVEVAVTHGITIHILVIDKTANLVDGYRTIKELIYNNMAIFMFNLYNKVIEAGIKPKGIKTDSILVFESKEDNCTDNNIENIPQYLLQCIICSPIKSLSK